MCVTFQTSAPFLKTASLFIFVFCCFCISAVFSDFCVALKKKKKKEKRPFSLPVVCSFVTFCVATEEHTFPIFLIGKERHKSNVRANKTWEGEGGKKRASLHESKDRLLSPF